MLFSVHNERLPCLGRDCMILNDAQRDSTERILLSIFTVVLTSMVIGNLNSGKPFSVPHVLWGLGTDALIWGFILYLRRRST